MTDNALANLLLNIEPSQAITPSYLRASRNRNGGKIIGSVTCVVPLKYPRDRSGLKVITLSATFSSPSTWRTWRSISSTRTSEPVLREPLYPAKSSLSFSPGFQGWPEPSIHNARVSSIDELTHPSRTRSIMAAIPACAQRRPRRRPHGPGQQKQSNPDMDTRNGNRG